VCVKRGRCGSPRRCSRRSNPGGGNPRHGQKKRQSGKFRQAGGRRCFEIQVPFFGSTTNGFTNGTSPQNTPTLGPATFDGSSYLVFLTNGGADAVTSTTDTDDTITLTSFASGPNQIGFTVLQAVYAPDSKINLPTLPGLLTMPGRSISLNLPNSHATMGTAVARRRTKSVTPISPSRNRH
jgi:hypothetical protein